MKKVTWIQNSNKGGDKFCGKVKKACIKEQEAWIQEAPLEMLTPACTAEAQ